MGVVVDKEGRELHQISQVEYVGNIFSLDINLVPMNLLVDLKRYGTSQPHPTAPSKISANEIPGGI